MTAKPDVIPAACGQCSYFSRTGVVQGRCRFYNTSRYSRSACLAEADPAAAAETRSEVAAPPKPAEVAPVAEKRVGIEVEIPSGEVFLFKDRIALREAILTAQVLRDYKARVLTGAAGAKEPDWSTVLKVARPDFKSQCLYEPIAAHIKRGATIGAMIGIGLKLLDTTIVIFNAKTEAGLMWLLVLAAILTPVWKTQLMIAAFYVTFRYGGGVNLFMAALSASLVGASFGLPAGMAIGALVGWIRGSKLPRPPDARPEGVVTFAWGAIAPLAWLAFWIPFFFLWLTPRMLEWMERSSQ